MYAKNHEPTDPAFSAAWQLFRTMHDSPSLANAEQLIRWLGRDPGNVRALDDALTVWALAGAALVDSELNGDSGSARTLQ